MNAQAAINVAGGIICILLGWILHNLWNMTRDLQIADDKLADRLTAIQLLVAGQYVSRQEFTDALRGLGDKLDKISDKLDGKADK